MNGVSVASDETAREVSQTQNLPTTALLSLYPLRSDLSLLGGGVGVYIAADISLTPLAGARHAG